MELLITPLEDLFKEAQFIQEFTDMTCSEDPLEIRARGNDLSVYMSRTAKMLADAKYHYNVAQSKSAVQLAKDIMKNTNLSATVQNKTLESSTKEESYLVDWIERLNRTCTNQQRWCITQLSYAKQEMLSGLNN